MTREEQATLVAWLRRPKVVWSTVTDQLEEHGNVRVAAHKSIIEAADARHAQASRDAYRRNFGLKAATADGVLADRDARAFAAGLKTPADALKALTAADLRGDHSMSGAIAERAWTERKSDAGGHWGGVLTAYAAADPDRNRDLGALAGLDGDDSPAARFTDRLYRHLGRPDDLPGNLEVIAAQPDSPASAVT